VRSAGLLGSRGDETGSGCGRRESNTDLETAIGVVSNADGAAVDLDRAAGDGETETGAAGCPLPRVGNPSEGFEEGPEMLLGHTGPVVTDGHGRHRVLRLQLDLDR